MTGDWRLATGEVATRTAHPLKGLAGNIGADGVALVDGEMETQRRHGADATKQYLAGMTTLWPGRRP